MGHCRVRGSTPTLGLFLFPYVPRTPTIFTGRGTGDRTFCDVWISLWTTLLQYNSKVGRSPSEGDPELPGCRSGTTGDEISWCTVNVFRTLYDVPEPSLTREQSSVAHCRSSLAVLNPCPSPYPRSVRSSCKYAPVPCPRTLADPSTRIGVLSGCHRDYGEGVGWDPPPRESTTTSWLPLG